MALINFDDDDDAAPSYEMVHPAPQGHGSNFALLYLLKVNYVRLLQFSEQICEEMESVVTSSWPKGIKKRQYVDGSLEFQLNGTPWGGMFPTDAIHGRDLMLGIFSYLYSQSWVLVANPYHTVHRFSKDSLIFKKAGNPPPPADFMALSMPPADRLRVHSGDQQTIAELQALLEKFDYFKSATKVATAWQFKMNGFPWMALCGKRPQKLRKFVLGIMETMDRLGWSSYATIKQRETDDNPKPDTWYFVRLGGGAEQASCFWLSTADYRHPGLAHRRLEFW